MNMTNTNLLKSKMVACGDDDCVQSLSKYFGCSRATASKKLNGKFPFTQTEIALLARRYGFTADDIKNIFFGGENNGHGGMCETS